MSALRRFSVQVNAFLDCHDTIKHLSPFVWLFDQYGLFWRVDTYFTASDPVTLAMVSD